MKKKKKLRLYTLIKRRFESDVVLQKKINSKSFTGKPETNTIEEYNIKAAILYKKSGYKLTSLDFQNQRQNTDTTMDIYFHESLQVEPKIKDIVLWNSRKYQINKLEDNRITGDFWKGEIIELSRD